MVRKDHAVSGGFFEVTHVGSLQPATLGYLVERDHIQRQRYLRNPSHLVPSHLSLSSLCPRHANKEVFELTSAP